MENLIERLRKQPRGPLCDEAADALQSQAERIKELELDLDVQAGSIEAVQAANSRLAAERDTLRAELADAELHTKQVERGLDKATAQLAEIEKTEPVAWMTPSGEGYMIRFTEPMTEVNMGWDKLYAAPAANSVMGHSDATLKQAVRDALDAQGVAELVEAFEHHIEQTRPIERSTIALSKYKGAK